MDITEEQAHRLWPYFGRDIRERRTVSDEAFREYSGSWTLEEFQKVIADAASLIPPESRPAATVELGNDYGEASVLVISYDRLETDEEVAANIASGLAYLREQDERDAREFERLSAKFAGAH